MKKGLVILVFALFLAQGVSAIDYIYCSDLDMYSHEVVGSHVNLSLSDTGSMPAIWYDYCSIIDGDEQVDVDSCSGTNCYATDYYCNPVGEYYDKMTSWGSCSDLGYAGCISGGCTNDEVVSCDDEVLNGDEIGIDCGGSCGACVGELSFKRAGVDPGNQEWTIGGDMPSYLNVLEIVVDASYEDIILDKILLEVYPWEIGGQVAAERGYPDNPMPIDAIQILIQDKNEDGIFVGDPKATSFSDGDIFLAASGNGIQDVEPVTEELPLTFIFETPGDGLVIPNGEAVYLSIVFVMGGDNSETYDYFGNIPDNQYTIKLKSIEALSEDSGLGVPVIGEYFTNTLTIINPQIVDGGSTTGDGANAGTETGTGTDAAGDDSNPSDNGSSSDSSSPGSTTNTDSNNSNSEGLFGLGSLSILDNMVWIYVGAGVIVIVGLGVGSYFYFKKKK